MAANEVTGVDYQHDRFAVYRQSTSEFINMNAQWPRIDGGPLVGLNPDLKYYKRTPSERPDADHRYTVTTTWDRVDTDPLPPEGHPAGVYLQSHTATKLPKADLNRQVETEFQHQLSLHFPQIHNPAVLIEAADAITRKQNGAVLTPEQEATLSQVVSVGDVVAQLRARQTALNAAIEADEDYDITDGWPAVAK